MRELIFILFIVFFIKSADGQIKKQINIPIYKNGDTTLWYKWYHERDDKLKLQHVITSTDSIHFRFWSNGQAIDIWTKDYKEFKGSLTNYADAYESENIKKQKKKPSKTFFNQVSIDTSAARQSFELIKFIFKLPTDDSIKGWKQGCDGITYLFEISTPTYYAFKNYWTPTAQDSTLIEARQIQTFVDKIAAKLNLHQEYEKFFASLKPGSYSNGSIVITTILTKKQAEKWDRQRPNREYMETINDTLNNYLCDTLTKIFETNGEFTVSNELFLKFSPRNRLKRIRTEEDFYGLSDRMDYYKCKRKIRKAFRKIHFDFVKSKVSYWREFSYYNKKILIL